MLEKNRQRLHIVIRAMKKIWIPLPITAAKSRGFVGGRKTSPWTNFQPVSSMASSRPVRLSVSPALYLAISLLRVRTMIIVRIPANKKETFHNSHFAKISIFSVDGKTYRRGKTRRWENWRWKTSGSRRHSFLNKRPICWPSSPWTRSIRQSRGNTEKFFWGWPIADSVGPAIDTCFHRILFLSNLSIVPQLRRPPRGMRSWKKNNTIYIIYVINLETTNRGKYSFRASFELRC